jgi:hypothetical protein
MKILIYLYPAVGNISVYLFRSPWQVEQFEDTKGEIRIRISKKNRQRNGHFERKIYKTYT